MASNRRSHGTKYTEICVGNINYADIDKLLEYFGQYGEIVQHNLTSSIGGYVFINYKDTSMVNRCMSARPHYFDNRHLYVKRALPADDEHPRERFETTRDLMIVIDFDINKCNDEEFLTELHDYFSSYGQLYTCKYCQEEHFNYILVQFADKDHVDQIILDKPHYYRDYKLHVMKYIPSNIEIMNKRYAPTTQSSTVITNPMNNDCRHTSYFRTSSVTCDALLQKELISEVDLEREVYRLQEVLKNMNDKFVLERKQLEDKCEEQLKKIHEDTDLANYLQQDLEHEYARLSMECESLKRENETLKEQYITVELENFEITSYYDQILDEEKSKTAQLEAEYAAKLKASTSTKSSTSSSPSLITTLSLSKSPVHSVASQDT